MSVYIQVPKGLTTEGLLGKRYMARFLDMIVLAVVFGVPLAVVTEGAFVIGFPVLWITYNAALETSAWQATVGKRMMGIRVYSAEGGRITAFQSIRRTVFKDAPFFLFAMLPGTQLLAWLWLAAHLVVMHRSPVYQAIHDRLAGTWVAAPEETTQLRLS
jgi:uncharacterized RDD family membrane protein YckC